MIGDKEETLRLLLVDTPETKHPNLPVQEYGPEASQFSKDTLSGRYVQLEYDGPKRDKYDRLLVHLWIDGKIFNQMLLGNGLARIAYIYDPPYNHFDNYQTTETRARETGIGIWSIPGYVTDDGFNMDVVNSETGEDIGTTSDLKYDPNGPDRDCGDFDTWEEAQAFFEAAGGPERDPHRLDRDKDGIACDGLR